MQRMEPSKQIEVQLGHMCNNRCVFCVSGQETALGRALPLDVDPVIGEIEKAFADGHRKLTLLGGEPTLQPGFMNVVRRAVALGFHEIVIFTNGVKTAREAFLDEILATGGRFTWRISIQGATKESHERTTLKDGSFDRIARTMALLKKKGERITVNMCVVASNYESVSDFPALLLPVGAQQLHLDMVRPLDAGVRTEDEMRGMIPRYSAMVPGLEKMMAGFPDGFDANIGNMPYCIAPKLARWIHHDGERTLTIAVDGGQKFSKPWDKYLVKRRDKVKPDSCASCVFDSRCSGVFETYQRFYGADELVPVTLAKLTEVDPERRMLALHVKPFAAKLLAWSPPAPYVNITAVESGDTEITVTMTGALPGVVEPLVVALRSPGSGSGSFELFSVHVLSAPPDRAFALSTLRAMWLELSKQGHRVLHPAGGDALGGVARSVAARVDRLRSAAPFGELEWHDLVISQGGKRAEVRLRGPAGERATVWLAEEGARATGGYIIDGDKPTAELAAGLRAVMVALAKREAVAAASTSSSI